MRPGQCGLDAILFVQPPVQGYGKVREVCLIGASSTAMQALTVMVQWGHCGCPC